MFSAALNVIVQKNRHSIPWSEFERLLPDMFSGAAMPPYILMAFAAAAMPKLLPLIDQIGRLYVFLAGLMAFWVLVSYSYRRKHAS